MDKLATPVPCTFYGLGTASIFDDSDPAYHADALSGETPARARNKETRMAVTVRKRSRLSA